MTADEIRKIPRFITETLPGGSTLNYDGSFVVQREIAAQLAELNANLKHFEQSAAKLQLDFLRADVR